MIYSVILLMMLLLSFLECFGKIAYRNKKQILIGVSCVFVILAAIRTNTAGDYYNYKLTFDVMMNDSSWSNLCNRQYLLFEPFYSLLMLFCKLLIPSYVFFQFAVYGIMAVLQYKTILYWGKKIATPNYNNGYELTAYFLLWGLYLGNIFPIRSTIALWICLYSIRFIEKKRIIKFGAAILAAMMFHYSALIFLPAYVVYWAKINFSKKFICFMFLAGFGMIGFWKILPVLIRFLPAAIQNKAAVYINSGTGSGTGYAGDIKMILLKAVLNIGVLLLVCWLVQLKIKDKQVNMGGYVNLYLLGSVLYLCTMFQSYAFARIAIYYNALQIPILLASMKCYIGSKNKFIYWFLLVLYICLRFAVTLLTGSSNYLPFTTIFHG